MSNDPRPPRRERERLRHRQEILVAARRVLADRGLDGLTVDEVAREAEFAVGSIYRHFSSKEDLLEQVFTGFLEDFVDDLEEIVERELPFAALLGQVVEASSAHLGEVQAVIHALIAAGPRSNDVRERLSPEKARIFDALDRLLSRGQAEGAVAAGDRRLMAISLIGTVIAVHRAGSADLAGGIPALLLDGFRPRP